jgi:dUTP pyrophosphatase
MKVRLKKLHQDAIVPSYAKHGDAGMDLTAVSMETTVDYVEYKTGIAIEIPEGYVGLLFPRSSNSKKDLLLCNSVGVVDSAYRGEICLRFKTTCQSPKLYSVGERVGQIMILPYPQIQFDEVEELTETERGTGGFGSTNP